MPSQEIQRLHVKRGSDLLIYEKGEGVDPAYLVRTSDGSYTVHLVPGQYAFFGDETGPGQVQIDLVGGGIHDGTVLSTIPEELPENATSPIELVLKISA
jgi:hypothetical protein